MKSMALRTLLGQSAGLLVLAAGAAHPAAALPVTFAQYFQSKATNNTLAERLSAARQRFHERCGGEVIGNACMRCGTSGAYQWAIGSDGKAAVTQKAFPIVHFVTEG